MFLQKLKAVVLIALVTGVLLTGGGLFYGMRVGAGNEGEAVAAAEPQKPDAKDAKDEKPVATVRVVQPVRTEFTPYQQYTGRLESLRTVQVYAQVTAALEKVLYRAGDDIKKGESLFQLNADEYREQLAKATAALKDPEARNAASRASMERAQKLAAQDPSKQGLVNQAFAELFRTKDRLNIARQEVERVRREMDRTTIKAPIAGRIGRPLVEAGNMVLAGGDRPTLLTTITVIDPIGVSFEMDERSYLDYQRLVRQHKVGGAGDKFFVGLVDEKDEPHEATLEDFDNQIDPKTGTIRVRGLLANPDGLRLPGMFVRVRFPFGPPSSVLEVPDAMVYSDQGKRYVLVVNDRDIVERRDVTVLGVDSARHAHAIARGLQENDRVVTVGVRKSVRPGEHVNVERAPHKN